jgi:hypothetical protein
MNTPLPPERNSQSTNPTDLDQPPVKRKHRWLRWLLALLVVILVVLVFLPNIIALPFFRQRLLNAAFSRLNTEATAGNLSLSWFSPVVAEDVKLRPLDTDRAALTVPQIAGDTSLWHLLWGRDLGNFRISKPELYVHFDREGTNITRLIRGMASLSLGQRSMQLEIVDGRLLLQGESSPQPWPIDKINLDLSLIPAAQSPSGVPTIHGQSARLLNETELTPEMCNDLLKFITPPLFQATRTSGKVSLELEQFDWPLGKPDAAKLSGQLTLHSVEVVPGPLAQLLNRVLQNSDATPLSLEIAKDDAVLFNMHDGRVYHENLTFRLSAAQLEMLVHSHGSVGLDETLDWFVQLEFPQLSAADLSGHPLLKLLSEKPTLHVTGTLTQPKYGAEGMASQAISTVLQIMRQRAEQRRNRVQPEQPANR